MPERPTSVAYVLKAFPRASEPFITSEIHRVEQAGLPLRLFAIKPAEPEEQYPRHPMVDRIRATPAFLPRLTPQRGVTTAAWLRANWPVVAPSLRRVAARWPLGLTRAVGVAAGQAVRGWRAGARNEPRVCLRELCLGALLADRLRDADDVTHLHAHFGHGATTVTWLAALMSGRTFSFTAHAKDIYRESLNPAGFLRRKMLAARFVVTCTEANRTHLRALAPEASVHRLYHGVNADFTRLLGTPNDSDGVDAPAAAPRAAAPLRVLGVGRLVAKKGFDTLVEACALLHRRGVAFELVIAGPDGGEGPALRARAERLGIAHRVRLPGAMEQAALFDEYGRASVFCLPCRVLADGDRDGLPNVLVEAMACGTPVVTTPISGIPEVVVDGENGLLVAPDDPAALADALGRLHACPALAARLGDAARRLVGEQFDGDVLAGRLVNLFAAVAS